MGGMNSGLSPSDPTLEAAFRSALIHQGLLAAGIVAALMLLWGASRAWIPASARPVPAAEPAARQVLRISFGLLWLLDGILQAQPQMPGGLSSQVVASAAQGSPGWVQDLVSVGGGIWSNHPIQAAASAVWIQAGIGLWLLVAVHGRWSRLAGAVSVAWGLVVWIWGEAFGAIFAPGLSWLTGAPGAVLLYCVAGALIALPPDAWRTARTGRLLLGGSGLYLIVMAVLQAWPGRGYWQGTINGQPGALAGMVAQMAKTPQPRVLARIVSAFAAFDTAHGFAVNLVTVIALAGLGVALLAGTRLGRPRLVLAAVAAAGVFCLAVWVLVQDLGFLGGLGTDPNSMIPTVLLLVAGYLAITRLPAGAQAGAGERAGVAARAGEQPGRPALPDVSDLPRRLRAAIAATSARTVAILGAVAVLGIGIAPMSEAAITGTADPILAEAISGSAAQVDLPAPGFRLTAADGRTVTLASLRGKVVLLTFLDPVCTSDCPIIAQEFKLAGELLGGQARQVELVAIAANPTYYSTAFLRAFNQQEGLSGVPDWLYLTGTLSQLRSVWQQYGIDVFNLPAGAMTMHSDVAFVIDPAGNMRQQLNMDPGPATTSTQSSFGALLAADARQLLGQA